MKSDKKGEVSMKLNMFAPMAFGRQLRARKPAYCSFTARAVALCIAVSMLSVPALAFPGRGPTPPSTPGDFRVTGITTSSVSFAWNASTNGSGGKLGYNIFNDTTGFSLNVGNVTSTTWTIGVQAGGTYSFHIEAYSGTELVSAASPEVTVTLLGTPLPTPVKPAAPVITQANPTSNTITVAWTESTPAKEISSYDVLVNGITDGGGPSGTTASTASGLASSYTFTITVVAYSLSGTTGSLSTTSAPVTVKTAAATTAPAPSSVLTAPTDLTGGGDGGGEAIISWNPSTSANEPQADITYEPYIDGVLDSFDSSVGDTNQVYIFPRGADEPASVWLVAVDNLGNVSAPSNVLTGIYF
jgi:hypothetical protein